MDRVVGNTFRCGWRVIRQLPADRFGYPFVDIKRGAWHYRMDAGAYDLMPDEYFADLMTRAYRESMSDQLQQDLDVLARYCIDAGAAWGAWGIAMDSMPGNVREVLERYEATKNDMQDVAAQSSVAG